jgi:hypothetical protein
MKRLLRQQSVSRKVKLREPELSFNQAEKLYEDRYLTGDGCRRVTGNEWGVLNNRTKYLFLRNVLSPEQVSAYYSHLRQLRYTASKHSLRPCLQGSQGGYLNFGWTKRPKARLFEDSKHLPMTHHFTLPVLVFQLGSLVQRHLPNDWKEASEAASKNGHRLILPGDWKAAAESVCKSDYDVPFFSEENPIFPGAVSGDISIFSSVAINKDTTCRSHVDARNASGLGCMTVFGKFSSGEFCMPRLGLIFDVQPGDVLIADTNNEQHGNLDGRDGERISVIAYLRTM